ncbi:MAG: DnaB-like helicase N-terminal domain-containing protein [Candidatus Sulfotelmatobacter sp.]
MQLKSGGGSVDSANLERALLGAFVIDPRAWSRVKAIQTMRASDFLLSSHRTIFNRMEQLAECGESMDLPSLVAAMESHNELDSIGDAAYLSQLLDGTVPENVLHYARKVREQRKGRDFEHLLEQLEKTKTLAMRLELIEAMHEALERETTDQNWRSIFHTVEEIQNAPPLTFAIHGFLQEAGVNLIGGLAGHGKTLAMLSMVKALLEESHLFGDERFPVTRRAERVIYLIPESSIGPFWSRVKLFHLEEFVREDRLLIRTLSSREQVELTDPRMLAAVENADVFLDSVVRFTTGSENDAENIRMFSDVMFRLLHAGARTITGCHHSPKSFETAQSMTLENVLRGSGDLGAMICTCWGVRQIDAAHNRIYFENCKPRDFQPCPPFIIEGRPHLDETGQFRMYAKPGEAQALAEYLVSKGGRPVAPDRAEQQALAASLRAQGLSTREIARRMKISKDTVRRMLDEFDLGKREPEGGEQQ